MDRTKKATGDKGAYDQTREERNRGLSETHEQVEDAYMEGTIDQSEEKKAKS